MDFLETIASNIPDLESFRNFAVLFSDLLPPKLIVEKHWLAKYLIVKGETLQRNQFGDSGEKLNETRYKDDKKDGNYTEWDVNGNKRIEGRYSNGVRNGHWIQRYENGVIEEEGDYINDKKDGLWIFRLNNGQISSETNFRDGKTHGINTFYNDDETILFQTEYLDGKYIKTIIY